MNGNNDAVKHRYLMRPETAGERGALFNRAISQIHLAKMYRRYAEEYRGLAADDRKYAKVADCENTARWARERAKRARKYDVQAERAIGAALALRELALSVVP